VTVRVVLDQAAIDRVARDPGVVDALERTAAAVAAAARTNSPRRARRTIVAAPAEMVGGVPVVDVVSHYAGAAALEAGSINNPPLAPFQKAVRALGLRLGASR
jgi:hypothetical protein